MNKMRVVPEWQTYLPHVLAIALGWALVMSMDYADAAAQAEQQAQDMSRQMAECMNGRWVGTAADGTRIGCMPAETLAPENTSTRKSS